MVAPGVPVSRVYHERARTQHRRAAARTERVQNGSGESTAPNYEAPQRTMSSYAVLTRFTGPGIENVAESPDRTGDAIAVIESLGEVVREFHVVMGRHDGVLIADFPDDETAAAAVLELGSSGNVATETLKAFDLDAFREILARLEGITDDG